MRHLITILIISTFLTGCSSSNSNQLELLSYFWSIRDRNADTLIPYIRPYFYSIIDKKGDCIIVKSFYQTNNQFLKIKIEETIFNRLWAEINKIENDSILTEKCTACIYDGPAVDLIVKKKSSKTMILGFDDSDRTNPIFLKFYRYLDSLVRIKEDIIYPDSIGLLNSRDSLIKRIYEKEIKLIPKEFLIVRDSIKVTYK